MAEPITVKLEEAERLMDRIEEAQHELQGQVAKWSQRALDAEAKNEELERELAIATAELEKRDA